MNWKYFPCLIFLCYNEINSMEGNKMKKLFTYGILASIFIGGCATTKTPEQSYKSLKNYSSKILVNYRDINGDYRDVNNSCYNIDGVEKKCTRILKEPNYNYEVILYNDDNDAIISVDVDNGKSGNITYMEDSQATNYFVKDVNDEIISSSDGAALDDVKKDYKEILSNIGLSENEFRDSVEYFAKKEGKSIIDQALKEYKLQKPRDYDDIKAAILKDVEISKGENYINVDFNVNTENLLYIPGKDEGIIYTSKLDKNIEISILPPNEVIASTSDKKCTYSLNRDKIIDGNCTQSEIDDSKSMEFWFNEFLHNHRITLNELFTFFRQYNKG